MTIAATKACRECGELKPLGDFHKSPTTRDGRVCRCKFCACQRRRANYDGDSSRAYAREYRASASNRPTFEDRVCGHCGHSFKFYSSLNKSRPGQGKYCSVGCKGAAGRTDYTCETCGVTFNSWRSVPRRFCGLECAGRVTLETLTRGPHLYGSPAWRRDLREQILERDGRECQRCRSPFDLVVHHIVPWKVSRDNSPENLITVCRPCHGFIHGVATSSEFVPIGRAA